MDKQPDILCIGSVLWDVIGRNPNAMPFGADRPGRISRRPGGVAMNIAMTLRPLGMTPALLTAIGRDADGDALLGHARAMGMITDFVHRNHDHPTDVYMAVEDARGLVAAIADAHSLEAVGDAILAPLGDGRLGSGQAPYPGLVALDGNLTEDLLAEISASPLFARADLRVAPASPGKANRLRPLLGHPNATFYVNLEEAGLLCETTFSSSDTAAMALVERGAARAMVTAGPEAASDADARAVHTLQPPPVEVVCITGAGDSFMAHHIAAERAGTPRQDALAAALNGAARHISQG